MIDSWGSFSEIFLRRMSLDFTNIKSTLVQVMAWCCQAITYANVDPNLCRHMASLGLNTGMIVSIEENRRAVIKTTDSTASGLREELRHIV